MPFFPSRKMSLPYSIGILSRVSLGVNIIKNLKYKTTYLSRDNMSRNERKHKHGTLYNLITLTVKWKWKCSLELLKMNSLSLVAESSLLYHSCWLIFPQNSQSARGLTLAIPPTEPLPQPVCIKARLARSLHCLRLVQSSEALDNCTREIDISRAATAALSSFATHSTAHTASSVREESYWESALCLPGKRSVGGS